MSTKEAYQEKIEAEVELALAKLTELKAQARTSAADARIKYGKQIDALEQEVVAIRSRVKEMAAAGEDSWEQLKYGVEHEWNVLSAAVQDAVTKYKKKNFYALAVQNRRQRFSNTNGGTNSQVKYDHQGRGRVENQLKSLDD